MFKVGDRALVLKEMHRKDWRSKVVPGEEVAIYRVSDSPFESTQIVDIEMADGRLPIGDIVCFVHSSPLEKVGGVRNEEAKVLSGILRKKEGFEESTGGS